MNTAGLQLVRISSDELPAQHRLDILREVYGRTILKLDIEPIGDGPYRFEASFLSVPGLGFTSGFSSPGQFICRPEHIERDDFVLHVCLSGGRVTHQLGREAVSAAGDAVLTTCGAPGAVVLSSDSQTFSLRMPRTLLEANVADLDACLLRPIRSDNRALQLLKTYVGGLPVSGALAVEELRSHVLAHVHDLLWTVLGPTRDAGELAVTRGVRAARLSAIKRNIAENLHDCSLSASAMAARHGITPRYVHMLFETEGITFSAYVFERRVARAYDMLGDPAHLGSKISTIAAQCGFQDVSWFNRVFRRRYGMTPSDVRETALRRRR